MSSRLHQTEIASGIVRTLHEKALSVEGRLWLRDGALYREIDKHTIVREAFAYGNVEIDDVEGAISLVHSILDKTKGNEFLGTERSVRQRYLREIADSLLGTYQEIDSQVILGEVETIGLRQYSNNPLLWRWYHRRADGSSMMTTCLPDELEAFVWWYTMRPYAEKLAFPLPLTVPMAGEGHWTSGAAELYAPERAALTRRTMASVNLYRESKDRSAA